MQKVLCPQCGEVDAEIIYTKCDLTHDIINVICTQCDLVFIWPRPKQIEFQKYQGESGKASGHHATSFENIQKKISSSDAKIKSTVANFLAPYLKSGMKVVDVGCGFGTLLSIIKNRFALDVEGVELNEQDARVAREQFGLNVFNGTFEQFVITRNEIKYDAILLHHTFEHFLNPRSELQRIAWLLKPNGLLYIAVPNIMKIKKRPDAFFIYSHACTYSPFSLKKILASNGFKIILFNNNAGYPGGMECVAVRCNDSLQELKSNDLLSGNSWKKVIRAVKIVDFKFKTLRVLRSLFLFWLPVSLRNSIGRKVYLFLKNKKSS